MRVSKFDSLQIPAKGEAVTNKTVAQPTANPDSDGNLVRQRASLAIPLRLPDPLLRLLLESPETCFAERGLESDKP